jgi:hypothetical protein
VHGRFSAAFGGIRDLYQRQLDADGADDPTDEIAVMRTAIELKVSCAMKGDSPKFRAEVLAAFERVASATPPEQQSPDFRALGELLRAGVGTDAALREVFDMADRTADRTTQLRRVRVAEMKVYTEAHIALMLKVFVETVREHTDVQTALRVATALDRRLALAASNSGPPRGSGEG